jgi:hypothetical protein
MFTVKYNVKGLHVQCIAIWLLIARERIKVYSYIWRLKSTNNPANFETPNCKHGWEKMSLCNPICNWKGFDIRDDRR